MRKLINLSFFVVFLFIINGFCYGIRLIDNYSKSLMTVTNSRGGKFFINHCLEHGINLVDPKTGISILHITAYDGEFKMVEHLLKQGADVNIQYKGGATALHDAAYNLHVEVVKVLIKYGADVNLIREDDGWKQTALTDVLTSALRHPNYDRVKQKVYAIVDALIEAGADVNFKMASANTALGWATRLGDQYIVEQLIKAGADASVYNGCYDDRGAGYRECSLEEIAKFRGNTDLAEFYTDLKIEKRRQ